MHFEVDVEKTLETAGRRFTLSGRFSTRGSRVVLFGPSGSGKSLTLRVLAGLLRPDKGRVKVGGRLLYDSQTGRDVPSRRRRVGYMFQHYALFPHLTVRDNVAFGLKRPLRRLDADSSRRVDDILDAFGLGPRAGHRPSQLSGGQRQRVALARCLVTKPELLLLDEPFSALDQPLRLKMRAELSAVLDAFEVPTVLVTHDQDEATDFAQTVVFYRQGAVVDMAERNGDGGMATLLQNAAATFCEDS